MSEGAPEAPPVAVYQLHVWLREISPMIWRRLLVRSDTTIAALHDVLQIVMGWTDAHLHRFVIHGKDYGVAQLGGISFADDPTRVRLTHFGFRPRERFLYEYDFGDGWQHVVRVERLLPVEADRVYLASPADDDGQDGEEEREPGVTVTQEEAVGQLERLKWYLWHGNLFRALQVAQDLEVALDTEAAGAE
jgi:Plasmid pRiA4b ORF-3-like protein